MKEFGVLYGNIDESYSDLGAKISHLSHNLVGVYYPVSGQIIVILFRAFDGSRITYFGNYISLDRLSQSHLIRDLSIYPFSEDSWRIDGRNDSLLDRFYRTINRVLLNSDFQQDYKNMLLFFVGLSNQKPVTGYNIINNIILATTTNVDPSESNKMSQRSIVECRYFLEMKILSSNEKRIVHDDRIFIEVKNCLKHLTEAFCELMVSNKQYADRIGEIINKDKNFIPLSLSTSAPSEQRSHSLSTTENFAPVKFKSQPSAMSIFPTSQPQKEIRYKIPDVGEEMGYLRDMIEDIMSGFNSSRVPVIKVPEIVENYNKLADKLNQTRINPSVVNPQHRSIGVLAQSSALGFYPDDVKVELKCGEVEIIPVKYDNFDHFTDDQLIQFHRYVVSHQSSDSRFNYMTEQIIRELATRAQA